MASTPQGDDRPVHTVEQALDLLEALASARAMSLGQLAAACGRSKPTTHRVLQSLIARGYVDRTDSGDYRSGLRCVDLGARVVAGLHLVETVRPYLDELSQVTAEVVHLGVYDKGDVVYLEKLESSLPVAPQSRVGTRAPAHCVGIGRVLLAYQPPGEIQRLIDAGLQRYTEATVTDGSELKRELEVVRSRGYAVNQSSWREGVCGIGAVVRNNSGTAIAAVGCCVPQSRFSKQRRRDLAAYVTAAADRMSGALGYRTGAAG